MVAVIDSGYCRFCGRASAEMKECCSPGDDPLEARPFFELSQAYRHEKDDRQVVQRWEDLKAYIREHCK